MRKYDFCKIIECINIKGFVVLWVFMLYIVVKDKIKNNDKNNFIIF